MSEQRVNPGPSINKVCLASVLSVLSVYTAYTVYTVSSVSSVYTAYTVSIQHITAYYCNAPTHVTISTVYPGLTAI